MPIPGDGRVTTLTGMRIKKETEFLQERTGFQNRFFLCAAAHGGICCLRNMRPARRVRENLPYSIAGHDACSGHVQIHKYKMADTSSHDK